MNTSIKEGKKKVLAAMSGGVDSSAAALSLNNIYPQEVYEHVH